MPSCKSSFGLLFTTLLFVSGTYFGKTISLKVIETVPLHVETSILLTAISITLSSSIFLRRSMLKSFKDIIYFFLVCTREHLGIYVTISACIFTARSFYFSFYDFETYFTSLYAAFVFVIFIIVTYVKREIPSCTVLFSMCYLSLVLAFLRLVIMLTPNMINSAFTVSFTATFSLLVSAVLFLINVTKRKIVTGLRLNEGEKFINTCEFLDSLPLDEIAEEVFANEGNQECSSIEKPNYDNVLNKLNSENVKPMLGETCTVSEVKETEVQSAQMDIIVDEILKDLTDHVKSMNNCAKYLIAKEMETRAVATNLTEQARFLGICVNCLRKNLRYPHLKKTNKRGSL